MVFTALTFYETHSNAAVFFRGRPLYATLSGPGEIQTSVEHFIQRADVF